MRCGVMWWLKSIGMHARGSGGKKQQKQKSIVVYRLLLIVCLLFCVKFTCLKISNTAVCSCTYWMYVMYTARVFIFYL